MKTILVADRDNRVVNLVRLIFTEYKGYRVVGTSSGAEAVSKVRSIKPAIVLASVSLSDKDGYEVSKDIKNSLFIRKTPVVLLADSHETFDEAKAEEANSDGVLIKPFEGREIAEKVESLVTESKEDRSKAIKLLARTKFNGGTVFTLAIIVLSLTFLFGDISKYGSSDFDFDISKYQSFGDFDFDALKTQAVARLEELASINPFKAESEPAPVGKTEKREIIAGMKEENLQRSSLAVPTPPFPRLKYPNGKEAAREEEKLIVPAPSLEEKEGSEEMEEAKEVEGVKEAESVQETQPASEPQEEAPKENRYVVKRGDTLWDIANKFNTTVQDIKVANNLRSNRLDVGSVLSIPRNGEVLGRGEEVVPEERYEKRTEPIVAKETGRKVEVENHVPEPQPDLNRSYSIQIGAFREAGVAERIAGDLASKGYLTFLKSIETSWGESWHMIRIGEFGTREEAEAYAGKLIAKEPMIEDVIVVSERRQQRSATAVKRKATEEEEPEFEEERYKILDEIKREKVIKDIEEGVQEKSTSEEDVSQLTVESISRRYMKGYIEDIKDTKLKNGSPNRGILGPE